MTPDTFVLPVDLVNDEPTAPLVTRCDILSNQRLDFMTVEPPTSG